MNSSSPLPAGLARDFASEPRSSADPRQKYCVFLSYSHVDTVWARWLMRRLEGFRVPRRFQGKVAPIGIVGARIAPVFRDRDELPTSGDLGATIRTALAESATLVVICSADSARSRWVQEEILMFKRQHDARHVFAFIVGGEPKQDAGDNCFSPALFLGSADDGGNSPRAIEIAAADARPQGDGREAAFLRLVAGLLGVGFDDLRRRELQRRQRRLTFIATGSTLGMAVTLGLALVAWQARNDAQRRREQAEDLLGFMVSDLRMPLKKLNKLELLDAIGVRAMAYFASLNPRDLTDVALRRQIEALRQIGENRKDQARYPEALSAWQAAYESALILAARHPRNGEFLFERGQAEFWIGYVLRRLGRRPEMMEWFTRYRDTGVALVALNPAEPRWQEELASGHHNLAVIDADEERIDAARRGFLGEMAMLQQLMRAKPQDHSLQVRLADVSSWLGSIAEMDGDLVEAETRFAEQVASTEAILRAEPDNAMSRHRFAEALSLHASILAITGQATASARQRQRARAILDALAAGDPQNQSWMRLLIWARLRELELLRVAGSFEAAMKLGDELRERFEKISAAEPKDQRVLERLAFTCRLQAEVWAEQGNAAAVAAAARAVEITERLVGARQSYIYINACANAHLTAGRIAASRGEVDAARKHWQRAVELVEPRVPGSKHWRILLPAAHAYQLVGRHDDSRELVARLKQLGFAPLEPWPDDTPLFPQLKPTVDNSSSHALPR